MEHPRIIQGGMGVGVSDWRLARAVALEGEMGVVSGTALDILLTRRLQQGDPGGHMRRGLAAFPDQEVAQRILARYYREEGTPDFHRFENPPMITVEPSREVEELLVAANFVEVYLAKEGHSGAVGVNFLEKIQLPNPAAIYGVMLAGVDYVLMGAGIPLEIPGLLDAYARGEAGSITLALEGAEKGETLLRHFDPARVLSSPPAQLKRPAFLSIVSSNVLAQTMVSRASGKVDGIIVEDHTAGGHNAPPRGPLHLTDQGEPVYGPKDQVDTLRMTKMDVPFWMAGSCSDENSLERSEKAGAWGIQVGTLFAFCRESGFLPELKKKFLQAVEAGKMRVFTHPGASPTGYPIKMALMEGTIAEEALFAQRKRVCNLGLLRHLYKKEDGVIGYRCPAESPELFIRKGGDPETPQDARCLCNALMAAVGAAMEYAGGYLEKPLLVPGEYLDSLRVLIRKIGLDYTAADVIRFLDSSRGEETCSS
ncbi:NAD(P)H-dependent flavin oxidoreductase YrpB, nitropropane dioxygenase family [Alkalispirochaeta americana]|uniref:NAD(P)H-dependent flavin oxidoreductase YrpB, nitropropane dioxygenase family n=1 Tax=Alkalispirochaeta americana TaxID=159291 RepID=A0A1N6T6X6_9SPIO|nr:nitronate monooxygenase [Alkalispirochaeta americana]SIQ49014.1 NAD(P)H-dependent flavin oxidoreductase YrpB, nitropropane dioxygenase family [Alkalispirochaeta americana]